MEPLKHELLVPQKEPFSSIKYQFYGTVEEATDEYHRLTAIAKSETGVGVGLSAKEFNILFDKLLKDKHLEGDPGELEKLNAYQKFAIDSLKRALRR